MKNTKSDIIHETIDRELFIDLDNLNDELMDQPLLYRKYCKLKAEANRRAAAIKNKLEECEASARLSFKKNQTKSTVADIDAMIATDPAVKKLKDEYLDASMDAEDLEGIVYALRQRHESIKELCANIRKEMGD